ncbi:hypothetical protein TYRP_012728, partial [Tyrophagus putrescentiae]
PLTISKFKILALFDWCLKRSRLSTAAESSQHARTGATTSSSSSSSLREGRGVGRARGPEVAAAVATEALLVPGAAAVAVVAAAAAATSAAGGGRDQLHWTELVWETVGGLQRSPSSSHHLRASRTASATSSSSSHQRHFYHHQQDYDSASSGSESAVSSGGGGGGPGNQQRFSLDESAFEQQGSSPANRKQESKCPPTPVPTPRSPQPHRRHFLRHQSSTEENNYQQQQQQPYNKVVSCHQSSTNKDPKPLLY